MAKNKFQRGVPRRTHGCQRPIDFFDARVRTRTDKYERNYRFDVACLQWSVRLTRVVPKLDDIDQSEYYDMTVRCRCKEPSWAVRARVSMYLRNYETKETEENDRTNHAKDFGVFRFHPSERMVTYKNILTVDDVMGEGNAQKFVKEGNFEPVITVTVIRVRVGFYPNISFAQKNLPDSDICAIVGKKKFFVHKDYMMIHSPFFETALTGPYLEKKEKRVNLKSQDVETRNFPEFLRSVYPLRKPIQQNHLRNFCGMADFFMMHSMTNRCERMLASSRCTYDIVKKFQITHQYQLIAAEAKLLQETRNKKDLEYIVQFCKDHGSQANISPCAIDVLTRRLKRIKEAEVRDYPRKARIEITLAKHADRPEKPEKGDLDRPYAESIKITEQDIEKYKSVLKKVFGEEVVDKLRIKPDLSSDLKAVKRAARERRKELTKETKLNRRRRIRRKKNEKRKEKLQAQQHESPLKPRGLKEKRSRKRKNPRPASTEPPVNRPQTRSMTKQATQSEAESGSQAMDVDN